MTTKSRPSVLVAYASTVVREALRSLLRDLDFEVTEGDATSPDALAKIARNAGSNIVLVDWELEGIDQDTVARLVQLVPETTAVVVITRPGHEDESAAILQAGATGYLSLNLPTEELRESLELLAHGHTVVSSDLTRGPSSLVAKNPEDHGPLSGREIEILSLVARGATNKEIAQRLIVTENTVKVHLRHILEKLDLRNRQQAAAYAVRQGLAPEGDENIDRTA